MWDVYSYNFIETKITEIAYNQTNAHKNKILFYCNIVLLVKNIRSLVILVGRKQVNFTFHGQKSYYCDGIL